MAKDNQVAADILAFAIQKDVSTSFHFQHYYTYTEPLVSDLSSCFAYS